MQPRISKRIIESNLDDSEIVEFIFCINNANSRIIGEINNSSNTLSIYDMDSFPIRNGSGRSFLKILSSDYTLIVPKSAPGDNEFWKKMVHEGIVTRVGRYCKGACQ